MCIFLLAMILFDKYNAYDPCLLTSLGALFCYDSMSMRLE